MQIISITGFLNGERISHFILNEAARETLREFDVVAAEKLVIPAFIGTVFAAFVVIMFLITILTLPAIRT